jgi:serine phosphatase RsbU (regulator of sigma subunit)
VVSTDGLTESRDAAGRMLGAERVTEWLGETEGSAQAVADAIVERLRARSSRITDDLAVLVIRYAPGAAARPREIPEAAPALSS